MGCLRYLAIFLVFILLVVLVGPLIIPIPPVQGSASEQELAYPDSQFIPVGEMTVHVQAAGEGEPNIVLLHGFGASTFSWREVLQPLGELGKTAAFDRPAFGLTERPMPGDWNGENPYSPEAQVDLLFGLMDQMGMKTAVLIGNSAGGTVAMSAALDSPERVQALILVDAAIYTGGGAPGFMRPFLTTPYGDRLGPFFVRGIQDWGDDFLRSAWHDPDRVTPEIISGYRKQLEVANWDRALWEFTKASRASNLSERLDDLRMPVLVITGDDDQIVPTEESLRLVEEIPGARLVVLEACGHLPQEECPQPFLDVVTSFIQDLPQ